MYYAKKIYHKVIYLISFIIALIVIAFRPPKIFLVVLPTSKDRGVCKKIKISIFNHIIDRLVDLKKSELANNILIYTIQNYRVKNGKSSLQIKNDQKLIPKIEKSLKKEVFIEVYSLFINNGFVPFLCFGLLLGLMRESDFMDHDNDFDLGFFYELESVKKIYLLLKKSGYLIEKYEPAPWPCRIKAVHRQSKLSLDLVFFKKESDKFLTYSRYHSHLLIRKRTPFNLVISKFMGINVWIPEFPEVFLEENYENWRVKSQYHHYIITSKLTDFSVPILQTLLLSAIIENIAERKNNVANILIEKWNQVRSDRKIKFIEI